jgi:hypothetical protein
LVSFHFDFFEFLGCPSGESFTSPPDVEALVDVLGCLGAEQEVPALALTTAIIAA